MKIKNYEIELFAKIIHKKELYCFGAGSVAEKFFGEFADYGIELNIKSFVDNDVKKWNTKKLINETFVDIISFDSFMKCISEKTVILITCLEFGNIIEKLEKVLNNYNVEVYIYGLLRHAHYEKNHRGEIPLNIKISKDKLIPKVIHYCWFGKNHIPEKNKRWMESWSKCCSDYEIVEWNETNYDVTSNKYMMEAYEAKKWGFVSDYARMDIIYRYGGIYLDTDVELVKCLDDLLYQTGFFGFQSLTEVASGLGFGAVKGSSIIKEMRDVYNNLNFTKEDGSYNLIACPIYQTEVLKKHGLIANGEYQIVDNITIYPEKVLCGKSLQTRSIILTDTTYAIHHFDGSWLSDKKRLSIIKNEELISRLAL